MSSLHNCTSWVPQTGAAVSSHILGEELSSSLWWAENWWSKRKTEWDIILTEQSGSGSSVTVLHLSAPLWGQVCWMKRSKPDRFSLQDLFRRLLGFTITFYFYLCCLEIFWVCVSVAPVIKSYIRSKPWKVKGSQGSVILHLWGTIKLSSTSAHTAQRKPRA